MTIASEIGAPRVQTNVFNNIGETLRKIGRYDEALQHHQSALDIASDVGERLGQARAHHGIAHVMHATDRLDEARAHWLQALALATELGMPLTGEVQAHLDALGPAEPGQRSRHRDPCRDRNRSGDRPTS